MRNDRKGAPARNLVRQSTHQSALAVAGTRATPASGAAASAMNMMRRGNLPTAVDCPETASLQSKLNRRRLATASSAEICSETSLSG
jgi:hypothetical protein